MIELPRDQFDSDTQPRWMLLRPATDRQGLYLGVGTVVVCDTPNRWMRPLNDAASALAGSIR